MTKRFSLELLIKKSDQNKLVSQRGGGLAEYALLVGLIAVVAIAALQTLGIEVAVVHSSNAQAIQDAIRN